MQSSSRARKGRWKKFAMNNPPDRANGMIFRVSGLPDRHLSREHLVVITFVRRYNAGPENRNRLFALHP